MKQPEIVVPQPSTSVTFSRKTILFPFQIFSRGYNHHFTLFFFLPFMFTREINNLFCSLPSLDFFFISVVIMFTPVIKDVSGYPRGQNNIVESLPLNTAGTVLARAYDVSILGKSEAGRLPGRLPLTSDLADLRL